jgi:hypothetical protein
MDGGNATAPTIGEDALTIHFEFGRPLEPAGNFRDYISGALDTHYGICGLPHPHSQARAELNYDLDTYGKIMLSAVGGIGGAGATGGNGQGGGNGRDGLDATRYRNGTDGTSGSLALTFLATNC